MRSDAVKKGMQQAPAPVSVQCTGTDRRRDEQTAGRNCQLLQ